MASRSEVIRLRIQQLENELVQVELFGADKFKNGTVIRWKHRFSQGGKKYTYAALKAGGRWYLTNQQGTMLTWDQLVERLNADGVTGVRVASGWEPLTVGTDAGEQGQG